MAQLSAKPKPINIIQVYFPTIDATDQDEEDKNGNISKKYWGSRKKDEDFNDKVSKIKQNKQLRKIIPENMRNQRGEMSIKVPYKKIFTTATTKYEQLLFRRQLMDIS